MKLFGNKIVQKQYDKTKVDIYKLFWNTRHLLIKNV